MFRDLPVTKSASSSYVDGDDLDNFVAFVNCDFDDGGFGVASDAGIGYRWDACYILNATGDLCRGQWYLATFGANRVAYVFDGVAFDADVAGASTLNAWYRVVACSGSNNAFYTTSTTNTAPTQNGILFESNQLFDSTLSSNSNLQLLSAISGVSVIGNIIEKTAGSNPAVHLWADNTSAACTHVVVAHNSWVGGVSGSRCNLFYNDRGTTAFNHKSVFFYGNQVDIGNIKSDAFDFTPISITRVGTTATLTCAAADASVGYVVGQNIFVQGANQAQYNGTFAVVSNSGGTSGGSFTYTMASDPGATATGTIKYCGLGRVGNWAQLFGSKWRANNIDAQSSSDFDWENLGVDGTRDTPTWEDAAANDYTPVAGSSLLNRVSLPYIPKDLYGRRFAGSAAVGAVQIEQPNVVGFIGGSLQGIIGS